VFYGFIVTLIIFKHRFDYQILIWILCDFTPICLTLPIIAQTSTHTWHHINLHGEFDFSEHQNKPNFDMNAILSLTIK
jgi:hypothetical protein